VLLAANLLVLFLAWAFLLYATWFSLHQFSLPKKERVPAVMPVIPGLTVPITALASIVLLLLVHELSHGILAEYYGARVKSFGIVYLLFIPVGAFVEIDDQDLAALAPSKKFNIFGVASLMNVLTGLLAVLLLRWLIPALHANLQDVVAGKLSVLFWFAVLSISIGLVNLLPLAGLDGYKMMQALEEMVRNRTLKTCIKKARDLLAALFLAVILLSFLAIIF